MLVSSVCLSQERGCEMCGVFFFFFFYIIPYNCFRPCTYTQTHTHTPQTHIKANTCTEMVCKGKVFSAPQQIILSVCKYVRVRCWIEIYIWLNVFWNAATLRSHRRWVWITGNDCSTWSVNARGKHTGRLNTSQSATLPRWKERNGGRVRELF